MSMIFQCVHMDNEADDIEYKFSVARSTEMLSCSFHRYGWTGKTPERFLRPLGMHSLHVIPALPLPSVVFFLIYAPSGSLLPFRVVFIFHRLHPRVWLCVGVQSVFHFSTSVKLCVVNARVYVFRVRTAFLSRYIYVWQFQHNCNHNCHQ